MKSIFQEQDRREILDRVKALTPDNPQRWGKMTISQMLAHVGDQLRMALGDIEVGAPRGPLRFPPLKTLVIYWIPWPEGRAQAPREAFTTKPEAWEQDKQAVVELIRRIVEHHPEGAWPIHPQFGKMSREAWGVLSYRHLDHHLRQFSA